MKKTFSNRLKSGRRQQIKLLNQHRLIPWEYVFWLTILQDYDMKRFKRRLSQFNAGRFNISWSMETARGAARPHFSGVMRTEETEEAFREYILRCLSERGSTVPIDLRIRRFDDSLANRCAVYQAKSDFNCLKRNELCEVGVREFFTTGHPWTRPSSELAKLQSTDKWDRAKAELLEDVELLWAYMTGKVTDSDLEDGRFLWKWRRMNRR